MPERRPFDADILVIGAGPVGMALALELGLRGNRVCLVERDASRGPQPRAKTLNMRSLAHMRRWGIADAVRAASPLAADLPTDIVFQTRLFGHHIATLPNIYFRGNTHAADPRFNEPSEWIPQYEVERVMKARLDGVPSVSSYYGMELVCLEQDEAGVTARLRGLNGGETTLRTRYLVGADGARSKVRDEIGAQMTGRYAYSANFNMMLEIPELKANPPAVRGIMYWIVNDEAPGVIGPIGDLWYLGKRLPEGVTGMSTEEIRDFVTATVGREVHFEVKSVDPWYSHELIADKYREGRIFLAGDACHLHPPFGGYGMNMGIADAVDLGWKLDAVLHGWADKHLLDSYEWERRRVHQWTINESIANYAVLSDNLMQFGMEDDSPEGAAIRAKLAPKVIEQKRAEFHTIGMVLGYHYDGSPVVSGSGDLPQPSAEVYDPVAVPGALAPHLWLEPDLSLYDRFGSGFTLISRPGSDTTAAFVAAAMDMGVPLTLLDLPYGHADKYPHAFTLVRPDQHIVWTGNTADGATAHAALAIATSRRVPI